MNIKNLEEIIISLNKDQLEELEKKVEEIEIFIQEVSKRK